MANTNSVENNRGQSYGGASFEPMQSYDLDTMEPDVYPGGYRAKCTGATAKASKKGKPMIELEWTMLSTESDSEGNQKSIGATKRDWVVFSSGRGGNFGKVKLRALRDNIGLDADVIPTSIGSLADLKPLCTALKNQEADVYIIPGDGEEGEDTQIQYTAPKEGLAPMGGTTDDEEEEERPAARKAATKAPVKGKGARR
jgi:hypothetical protein